MDDAKAAYKWLRHLQRRGNNTHDEYPVLSDILIGKGWVTVVKTWTFEGKSCRIIKAV